ncbi:MAG: peptidoglycan DD-metalloendopeptidase family protein [Candidatus Sedimenticola sp. (ex Thyasira tokunagai)]
MIGRYFRRLDRRGLLLLSLSLSLSLQVPAQAEEPSLSRKGSELKQLREQISDLQHTLNEREDEQQRLQAELQVSERQIGEAARRLRVLGGSLERQRQRIGQLQVEQRRQQDELVGHQRVLAGQVRAAYAMGRQERLKILLNQQDPAVVSRMLVYYDYFNRTRTERMKQIEEMLETLHKTELALTLEEQRLVELQSSEIEAKRQLDLAQGERRRVVAALNQDLRSKGQRLKGLQQDETQLQNLLSKLQEELIAQPLGKLDRKLFKRRKGKLNWPSKGRLTAKFGTARAGNLTWDGVVISAPEGREVRAIHHGRVAFADWLRGFGLLLIIDHGDGYMSLYGHNQSLFKETGEWVEAGEPVALVGSSGGQNNPGVYFGIRYKGRPVNPKIWCRRSRNNRVGGLINPADQDYPGAVLEVVMKMAVENKV